MKNNYHIGDKMRGLYIEECLGCLKNKNKSTDEDSGKVVDTDEDYK